MKVFNKGKYAWKIVLGIFACVLILRLVLPYIVLHYSNKTLARMEGYYGHIHDIDIFLYRGAYVIEDFYIDKLDTNSHTNTPFISSERIELSVEWKSLIHRRLVGEIDFYNPTLRFTKDKAEPLEIQKDTNDFRMILKTFMPLKINHFEIFNGKIQYIDFSSTPNINLSLTNSHVVAKNLSNVDNKKVLPANVVATAKLYGGDLDFELNLDPFAKKATFDMNAELKHTNLPELNSFFKAYAKFDINKSTVGIYTEMAGKDGGYIGYVKPVIKDLDIIGPQDQEDGFVNKVWERMVGASGFILKNPKTDQVAMKIPNEGKFGTTTYGTWYAITSLLRNAFIQAISPALDNQITISSLNAMSKKERRRAMKKKDRESKTKE